MSELDQLRELLIAKGMEYREHEAPATDCIAFFDGNGWHDCWESVDGEVNVTFSMTPAQAIAATLGRGTCKPILNSEYKHAPYINDWIVCSACGTRLAERFGIVWQRYCPHCGARITEVTE